MHSSISRFLSRGGTDDPSGSPLSPGEAMETGVTVLQSQPDVSMVNTEASWLLESDQR